MNSFNLNRLLAMREPRQHIYPVRTLPYCPASLEIEVVAGDSERVDRECPSSEGRVRELATVSWSRVFDHRLPETYLLERGERYWWLWSRRAPVAVGLGLEEPLSLLARASCEDVHPLVVGLLMLKAAFETLRDRDRLPPYLFIDKKGLLDVADLKALSSAVWTPDWLPPEQPPLPPGLCVSVGINFESILKRD